MADGNSEICILDLRPPAGEDMLSDARKLRELSSLGADVERGVAADGGLTVAPPFEPFQPIVAEQLLRVKRADRAISARQFIRGTELVAPPADPLRESRM